jgi:hypothetical protein
MSLMIVDPYRGSVAAGPFVPSSNPALVAWAEGDQLVATNGDHISSWGSIYPFAQATDANMPVYSAAGGPNSQPCLSFGNGRSTVMTGTGTPTAGHLLVLTKYNTANFSGFPHYWRKSTSGGGTVLMAGRDGNTIIYADEMPGTTGDLIYRNGINITATRDATPINVWMLLEWRNSTGPTTGHGWQIGTDTSQTRYWNADVAGHWLYDAIQSGTGYSDLITYINTKYGMAI